MYIKYAYVSSTAKLISLYCSPEWRLHLILALDHIQKVVLDRSSHTDTIPTSQLTPTTQTEEVR